MATNVQTETLTTESESTTYDDDLSTDLVDCTELPNPNLYYYHVAEQITLTVNPIIVIIGLVGNMISLLVMLRKHQIRRSVSIYLSALAISDSLLLLLTFTTSWLSVVIGFQARGISDALCKIHTWAMSTSYTASSWLVVAVSIERFIAVCFPLQANRFCTAKKAKLSVMIICFLSAALRLVRFWSWMRTPDGGCSVNPEWTYYVSVIRPWLVGTFYSYLPFLVLVLTNFCIIWQSYRNQKKRAAMTNQSADVFSDDTTSRVTRTVVAVCLAHLVFTIPAAVWQLIALTSREIRNQSPVTALAQTVIYIFGQANHSVNLFLYVLVSTTFRREVKKLFHCCGKPTNKNRHHDRSQARSTTDSHDLGMSTGTSVSNRTPPESGTNLSSIVT